MQWVLDAGGAPERSVEQLAKRMLTVNFVSIHTTSHALTCAIHHVAAEPGKYQAALRAEA